MNNDLSDVASAITGSLARDGQGGMTAVLPMANAGAVYVSDTDTGLHRTGANEQALFCGGTDRITANTTGGAVNGDLDVSGTVKVGGSALIPIGAGMIYFGIAAPPKWIFALGQTLLRADYPALWTFAAGEIALGSLLFTNGNGSTTFTIANLKGRVPANRDDTGAILNSTTMTPDGNTMGATGGNQQHTLTTPQIPVHLHTITDPGHVHTQRLSPAGGAGGFLSQAVSGVYIDAVGVFTATATTGITQTNNTGSGSAHNNVQPSIIVNYIIYAGA